MFFPPRGPGSLGISCQWWKTLLPQYPASRLLGVPETGRVWEVHRAKPSLVRASGTSLQCVRSSLLILQKLSLRCRERKSFAQQGHRASLLFCLARVIFILGLHFLNAQQLGRGWRAGEVGLEEPRLRMFKFPVSVP